MDLSRRRVLIVGLQASGQAAARLAVRRGAAEVVGVDLREDVAPIPGVRLELGRHRRETFLAADLVVVSPGVPGNQPDVLAAQRAGIEVVGELGFAWSFLEGTPMAAVTGTNGKSTVTHFVGSLLPGSFVGGNLGNPLSNAVGSHPARLVVEVSSYQLERPGRFAPRVGVVLNLTPDHLARHGDLDTYGSVKCRLFDRMGSGDFAILPRHHERLIRLAEGRGGRRLWLGAHPGVVRRDRQAILDVGAGVETYDLRGFSIPGAHNLDNACTAILVARAMGAPVNEVAAGIAGLSALPHRMQLVLDRDGVQWIDDSKATNVDASAAGIGGLGRPAVVLLGGQAKDLGSGTLGFEALRPLLSRHRGVVTFGASGPAIARELGDLAVPVIPVGEMSEAVDAARELCRTGDAVLLSPGCASFDAFDNFEHRGRVFRDLVTGGS